MQEGEPMSPRIRVSLILFTLAAAAVGFRALLVCRRFR